MTTPTRDEIEQLRSELPVVDAPVPPFRAATVRTTSPARSGRSRLPLVAVAATICVALVLAGVSVQDRAGTDHAVGVGGISAAEAREIAFDALTSLDELGRSYRASETWTSVEIGGAKRRESTTRALRREGDDFRYENRWDTTYFDRAGAGRTQTVLCVASRCYSNAVPTDAHPQHWSLDIRSLPARITGWVRSGDPVWDPPDFRQLVGQLEREHLASGERTPDGTVRVVIDAPARSLAPVGGARNMSMASDPVTAAAQGVLLWSPPGDDEPRLELTITVEPDGTRRIESTFLMRTTHPDGRGGAGPLDSEVTKTSTWTPISRPSLQAPEPGDVLVIGDATLYRRTKDATFGIRGTLDEFDEAAIAALRREVAAARPRWRRGTIASTSHARSYAKLWAANARRTRAIRAEIDRSWLPIERGRLSMSDRCTPFWPQSEREMDREAARRAPARAGWRCELRAGDATITLLPGADAYDVVDTTSGASFWRYPEDRRG
jgi:hypothetical protein